MTPDRIDHYRRLLDAQRDRLERDVRTRRQGAQAALDTDALDDREERAEVADTSLNEATLLTRQRDEIDEALLRIERGEYGRCEECGRDIEPERLDAVPATQRCGEHARAADRGHTSPRL